MYDGIIDLYHFDDVDLQRVQAAGITAIIHKATEGATVQDKPYRDRRDQARDLGFLWGAYHFGTNAGVGDQLANFLNWAEIDDSDFIALDYEPHGKITMSFAQAEEFVQRLHDELGRWPAIYGGPDLLGTEAPKHPGTVLGNCPLWYAYYREVAAPPIPKPWTKFTLWQYTDSEHGNQPRLTDGTSHKNDKGVTIFGCDRNVFDGTADDLVGAWPFAFNGGGGID